jgi:hypothetical protein
MAEWNQIRGFFFCYNSFDTLGIQRLVFLFSVQRFLKRRYTVHEPAVIVFRASRPPL